jgi:hypothetical protein
VITATAGERQAADVKIAQKIMAAHREAFRERFPGQVEHSLRLTAERLQACLNKPEGFVAADTATWPAAPEHIADMARALAALHEIYQNLDQVASE